jgi:hypothetical protein
MFPASSEILPAADAGVILFNGTTYVRYDTGVTFSDDIWDVYVVSSTIAYCVSRGANAVMQWDGTAWTDISATVGMTTELPVSISGYGSNDIWIGCYGDNPFHYNGVTWSQIDVISEGADSRAISYVNALGHNRVLIWGVDYTESPDDFDCWYYDGSDWTAVSPTFSDVDYWDGNRAFATPGGGGLEITALAFDVQSKRGLHRVGNDKGVT